MTKRSVAVIGGGITGLSAAHYLRRNAHRDLDVRLYEASDRLGGCIRGTDLDGVLPDTVDVGAEAALARRPEALSLVEELGLPIETPGNVRSAIFSRGALHPIPRGTVMGVPADPASAAGILDGEEVRRASRERLTDAVPDDVAVAEFIAARLGNGVADRLVDPLLGGVYAGDSRLLSLRATLQALWPAAHNGTAVLDPVREAARRTGADPGSRTPAFLGLRGGLTTLVDRLGRALGSAVRLGSPVDSLRRADGRWALAVGGSTDTADAVIVALPAHAAASVLGPCAPDVAAELAGIEFSTSAVVTALVDTGSSPLKGSGFLVPPVEARTIKAATFSSNKWPWIARMLPPGTALVRASAGRHRNTAVLDSGDDDLARAAMADVERITGRTLPVLASEVTRWPRALPQYLVGHRQRVENIAAHMKDLPAACLAGAAYDGVGIPACIGSARQAAETILRELRV